MASVAFHLNTQVKQGDNPKLFEGCDGFPDGGQMRDFIYVDDVCKVNLWFWQNPQHSGIFNCGTGRAEPFQNVAEAVIRASPERRHRIHSPSRITSRVATRASPRRISPSCAASAMTASSRLWPKAWPITWPG